MRPEEFEEFKVELKQLCASLGKTYTDPLGQAYWRALRDVSLDEIQVHVERILLNAKAETKFPKPSQLRTTAPQSQPELIDPALKESEERSIRNLEELRQRDPDAWEKHVRAARIAAGKDPDCNAIRMHRQFRGNVVYDIQERCWKRP